MKIQGLVSMLLALGLTADYEYDYYYDYYPANNIEGATPITKVVLIGSDLLVECPTRPLDKTNSSLPTDDHWELVHNGDTVAVDGERAVTKSQAGYLVAGVTLNDSGLWSCRSGPADGETINTKAVVSHFNSLSVLAGHELLLNNTVKSVREGTFLDLMCIFVSPAGGDQDHLPADPLPSWVVVKDTGDEEWTADGEPPAMEITPEQTVMVKSTPTLSYSSSTVSSHKLTRQSADQLSCRCAGKEISLSFQVEYQPEFTISREPGFGIAIFEGMSVKLKCSVDAQPPSQPVWEYNGVRMDPKNFSSSDNVAEINFDAIPTSKDGWYSCGVDHKFGYFSSVGYYLGVKPSLSKQNSRESDTETTVSHLTNQVILVDNNHSPPSRDSGCNDADKDHTLPVVTMSNQSYVVSVGSEAELSANYCANPRANRVFWSGPRVLLSPKSDPVDMMGVSTDLDDLGDGCHRATLRLHSVQEGDSGLYLLIVRNMYHVVEGSIELRVASQADNSTAATASIVMFFKPLLMLALAHLHVAKQKL